MGTNLQTPPAVDREATERPGHEHREAGDRGPSGAPTHELTVAEIEE
jgi:hypothetical protein